MAIPALATGLSSLGDQEGLLPRGPWAGGLPDSPQVLRNGENRCSPGQVQARRSHHSLPRGSFLRQFTFYLKTQLKCPFCHVTQPCSLLTDFPTVASYVTVQLTGFTPAFQCPQDTPTACSHPSSSCPRPTSWHALSVLTSREAPCCSWLLRLPEKGTVTK